LGDQLLKSADAGLSAISFAGHNYTQQKDAASIPITKNNLQI
jgi:hypothetical protein